MESNAPWYFYRKYTVHDVNDILIDLVELLNIKSKRKKLSDKSKQSYKEWLRPFLLKYENNNTGLNNREMAENYIDTLKTNKRDLTYVVNVRLLLQKLLNFSPPLTKVFPGELSDEKRTNEELVLSEKHVRAIKGWAEEHDSTSTSALFNELADYITIILMTGVRPFEARKISIKQLVDLRDNCSTRIIGKGQCGREIVCAKNSTTHLFLIALIKRLRCCAISDSMPAFQKSDRFYRREFLKLQKFTLLFQNNRFCSLHSLRRAAARTLFSSNKDIFVVKNFLGHKKVLTTERYLNLAVKDLIQKVTDSDEKYLSKYTLDT